MNEKILANRLRYIVSFDYQTESGFDSFCEMLAGHPLWRAGEPSRYEKDIYRYLVDAFMPNAQRTNVGCSFEIYTGKGKKKPEVFKMLYLPVGDKPVELTMKNAGLYLFRSGVGFFWYEVELQKDEDNPRTGHNEPRVYTCEQLAVFQNTFKELNFDSYGTRPKQGSNAAPKNKIYRICEAGDEREGDWVEGEYRVREFSMGDWIASLLAGYLDPKDAPLMNWEVHFLPDRENWAAGRMTGVHKDRVPDKAILFSYVLTESAHAARATEEDMTVQMPEFLKNIFCLTNGYTSKYRMPDGVYEECFRPFRNAFWYASRQGCGYFATEDESNVEFFRNNFPQKFAEDYFVLYILLLYQSYTLLHWSAIIAQQLSADAADYRSGGVEVLEDLETTINVFLLKSVYTSVSHIQHQNGFYDYVFKRLCIAEDIESVRTGMDYLNEMQKDIRQRQEDAKKQEQERHKQLEDDRLNIVLGFLSLLAVFSALADGFAISGELAEWGWQKLLPKTLTAHELSVGVFWFVVVIAVLVLLVLGGAIRSYRKNRRKMKGEKRKNDHDNAG